MSDATQLDRIEAKLDQLLAAKATPAKASTQGGAIAPASDLDGEYGNPEVRKDPKFWEGQSFVGRRYSECPADYLEQVAKFHDWRAGKCREEGDERKAGFAEKDAARARGWAARVLAGHVAKPALVDLGKALGEPEDDFDTDSIPF